MEIVEKEELSRKEREVSEQRTKGKVKEVKEKEEMTGKQNKKIEKK